MAKRTDWAMKSRTALNMNEFMLFDTSGSSLPFCKYRARSGAVPVRFRHDVTAVYSTFSTLFVFSFKLLE